MNLWTHFSFQWKVLQWEQLIVRKKIWKEQYMIFMRFNEWIIFIKKSRDWYINKYYWIDNCLIDNYDIDENVVVEIISFLWYLQCLLLYNIIN